MTKEEMIKRVLELKGQYEPDASGRDKQAKEWYEYFRGIHGDKITFEEFRKKFLELYLSAHQQEVAIYDKAFTRKELGMMIPYYGSPVYAREKSIIADLAGNNAKYLITLNEAFTGRSTAVAAPKPIKPSAVAS